MKRLITLSLMAVLVALASPAATFAAKPTGNGPGSGGSTPPAVNPFYKSGTVGEDVSYPNCSATFKGSFGIVGVNGGRVFNANPCLMQQAAAYSNDLSLYVNTGLNADPVNSQYYADALAVCSGDANCAAYKYGFNAGLDAIATANAAGVTSDRWWLDVETGNTWNDNTALNRQSLQGEYDALVQNGAKMVGVYSTTAQWGTITGGWLNKWYNWGATIVRKASQAAQYCKGHEFTGGQTLLIQFKGSIDQDYAC